MLKAIALRQPVVQALLTMNAGIPLWRVDEAEGMKIGAAEAASVCWVEGRTRKLKIETSNNRILTQSCISEPQGLEREMKV